MPSQHNTDKIAFLSYNDLRCEIYGGTNPIVETGVYRGATVRIYKDGMVDAENGVGFSLSPGFPSVAACLAWIDSETDSRLRPNYLRDTGHCD